MLDPGSAHFFNPSQHRPARKTASQNPRIPTLQRHQTPHATRQPPGSTGRTHRTSATMETLRNLQTKGQLQGRCHVHAAGLGPTLKIPSTRRHTLEILKCIEVRLGAIWTYFEEFSWNALKYNLFQDGHMESKLCPLSIVFRQGRQLWFWLFHGILMDLVY